MSPLQSCCILQIGSLVPPTNQLVDLDCRELWRELVNYMEGGLTPGMRERIQLHLRGCRQCQSVYDGSNNVVRLLGDKNAIELPQGFSQRLHARLVQSGAPRH